MKTSRPLIFLFPHLDMRVGGNVAQKAIVDACAAFGSAEIVSYGPERIGHRHLDDILDAGSDSNAIFVAHWGPDVQRLAERLAHMDFVYVAHSTRWDLGLPPRVPIICVSRNTLGFWGRQAPNSMLLYSPNCISPDFAAKALPHAERDIDVLVQTRKSSRYVLEQLVPALAPHCNLVVQDDWVEDLAAIFGRSKVYLYDSVEYWVGRGVTEGFGLPPLEALAAGCTVFSTINDALADYLTPGVNCYQLRVFSTEFDRDRILSALRAEWPLGTPTTPSDEYDQKSMAVSLRRSFESVEGFFKAARGKQSDIPEVKARGRLRRALSSMKAQATS